MLEISSEIKEVLKSIGLDRTEIQVFIFLLKEGPSSIQEISNKLNLPRSSIHLACEGLLNKDIAKILNIGKRRSFFIEKPKDIENVLIKKENEIKKNKIAINSIISKLTSLYIVPRGSEPIDIEELSGESGFLETYFRALKQPKNGEILRFGGDPATFVIKGGEVLKEYSKQRIKKRIFTKLLLPDYEKSKYEKEEARFKMREVRTLKKEIFDPSVNASIWLDNVAITIWDQGLHSIILRNQAFAKFMKQMFEIAWEQGDK